MENNPKFFEICFRNPMRGEKWFHVIAYTIDEAYNMVVTDDEYEYFIYDDWTNEDYWWNEYDMVNGVFEPGIIYCEDTEYIYNFMNKYCINQKIHGYIA